jgi:hypothetical protein
MQAGSQVGAGSATGAIAGGLLGGVAGWMVGVGALAIPGVGPLIAAGALASALGGAALGAGAGAVAGALIGMGMSEEAADHYEREVRRGQTLVAVRTDERSGNEAEHVLRRFGATEVSLSSRSSALSDARGGPAEAQPLQRSAMDQRDVAHARFDRGSDGPTAAGPLHQTGQ